MALHQHFLELADPSLDDDGRPRRTGYLEIDSTGEQDHEEGIDGCNRRDHFLLLCLQGASSMQALGISTPGNLLTGFGFYEPFWLIDFAKVCIVVHLVGGYQVLTNTLRCQSIFATFELWFARQFPNSRFFSTFYTVKPPIIPSFRIYLFMLFSRTLYIAFTIGLALAFPYFNSILGVLGAINFWPPAVYFRFEVYFSQRSIKAGSKNGLPLTH
ncbi:hypothetical protein CRG98_024921 [Punica granatum]|uniref:Amino acid transporter transmembrane domain-containing protein n=1 Tax=Punica granatum TaxID=22663 RepID=A0A2I0JEP7_PUNGR|nr:hypothetical protein CRG98_024921 [Punica granatum]